MCKIFSENWITINVQKSAAGSNESNVLVEKKKEEIQQHCSFARPSGISCGREVVQILRLSLTFLYNFIYQFIHFFPSFVHLLHYLFLTFPCNAEAGKISSTSLPPPSHCPALLLTRMGQHLPPFVVSFCPSH